jgi:ligand-binding sensor domain-containing protein/signal transduction histidine kinase
MPFYSVFSGIPGCQPWAPKPRAIVVCGHPRVSRLGWWLLVALFLLFPASVPAVILWTDPDTTLVHENGAGSDILGGSVKRDNTANDTLYFKFHVNPLSDKDTEEYAAAFELYEGDVERLGVGNALKAWAYSAFFGTDAAGESNNISGYIDLHTLKPESPGTAGSYQYPRRGVGVTIVFKIQYIPGEDDLVTVWLNPDLGPGANEAYQPEELTTRFNARATFDEIRLRHSGGGGGWEFSDLAIATSFSDFVDASSARPSEDSSGIMGGAQKFSFQSWQKEQGLPQNPVRALVQTHDDYLWMGGEDGLGRFDGLKFVPFGIQDGIKTGHVTALFEDRHHALWIGSADSGLSRWQNNQFTTWTRHEGLPANAITALCEDGTGRLWVGTTAGLVSWDNGPSAPLAPKGMFDGRRICALVRDRGGQIWIGAAGLGVLQFTNNRFLPVADDSPDDPLKDPHCLLVDFRGRLWVGAGDDLVLCREGDHWRRYRIPHNQARGYISSLAEEADGTVWAGSANGGLLQFKNGKFATIPANSGLAGDRINSLLVDHDGRLWVGTDAGLNHLNRKSLFVMSQDQGLGFGAVQSLAEVSPGVVWAGKPSDGLYRWDGKSFSRLPGIGLSSHDSQINALLVTHDGYCWVATTNNLLLYKDPTAAADEVKVIAPPVPNIISLAEDRDGVLWVGTREGRLWLLHENRWLEQSKFSQTNAITAIVPAQDGSMWVGTDGDGIYEFKAGGLIHFGRNEGLSSAAIRALFSDAKGALWIGTSSEGLTRLEHDRITNFTPHEGLPESISQILEDDSGNLWLGTGKGIACVNKQSLSDLADGRIGVVYPQIFGRAEGMLSEECTAGYCPAGLRTGAGLLWFSTMKGVAVVNPRVQPAAARPPTAILEEVRVDDVPMTWAAVPGEPSESRLTTPESLRIPPGKHRVEFLYTAINFDAPDQLHFRYLLDGLDTDWVEAGSRRTAFYSYLPPGTYHFAIAACGNNGFWGDTGPVLEVIESRHFWQTWWFISSVGVGLMVLVGTTVRIVEKRKLHQRLKRLEQERALERERTRIAQDLHDEMGAKLCRISFLSEHARRSEISREEMRDQIASISDSSREVLHSLDEIVWAVNPQNDTLEHVASYIGQYAEEYFQMTGIECALDIPTQLPPYALSSQARHHLFLATHEAITNILKHSGATRTSIAMKLNGGAFEIVISDNGKGFNASVALNENGPATPSGNGLGNMYRRLTDVGGHCEMESTPGQGTRIRFVIFLKPVAQQPPIKL